MRRLVALTVLALVATSVAVAAPPRAKVAVRATELGRVLVDARGHTLYVRDSGSCTGACLKTWPPFLTGAKPSGVAKLGTKKVAGGKLQVTFAGRPLFFYIGDISAGQVAGATVPHWNAVSPAGSLLHSNVSTTPPPSTTTPDYGGGGGGY
jgi:predicted lipoprotein with Yx(FWY)xxD motif